MSGSPAADGEVLLRAAGLKAGYDGVPVVHGIDLEVRAGRIVVLLGGNGAGKTTTLLTISGLLVPLGGELEVGGSRCEPRRRMRPADITRRARGGLAHVPEDRGLFFDLTARENLRLGVPRRASKGALDDVLDLFPALPPILDRKAGLLSGGEQQMLAMGRALAGKPKLLLVDEMSLGLAPLIVERLASTLRRVADQTGTGILLVEQHVAIALSIADDAHVMTRGHITTSGPAADLASNRDLLRAGYLGS